MYQGVDLEVLFSVDLSEILFVFVNKQVKKHRHTELYQSY